MRWDFHIVCKSHDLGDVIPGAEKTWGCDGQKLPGVVQIIQVLLEDWLLPKSLPWLRSHISRQPLHGFLEKSPYRTLSLRGAFSKQEQQCVQDLFERSILTFLSKAWEAYDRLTESISWLSRLSLLLLISREILRKQWLLLRISQASCCTSVPRYLGDLSYSYW